MSLEIWIIRNQLFNFKVSKNSEQYFADLDSAKIIHHYISLTLDLLTILIYHYNYWP